MAKVFIPFDDYKFVGGPATFMYNLKNYLDSVGYIYETNFDKSQNIFFPVSYDLGLLDQIKSKKGKIIQRLDGVYYPSAHTKEQLQFGELMKKIYLDYSDFIIFQSEYSKKQCFEMFGERSGNNYEIIVNGVDKKVFYPIAFEDKTPHKFRFITTGNFREAAMLEPTVKALDDIYNKKLFDFELIIVGKVADEFETFFDRPYVDSKGVMPPGELANELRQSDIFIFSFLNPACPNSVIEAISCGLPVVGFDTGSMSELLFFSQELLAYVSDDIFQEYKNFDFKKLSQKIELLVSKYNHFKIIAEKNAGLYSMEDCGKKYVEVIERVINTSIENIIKLQ